MNDPLNCRLVTHVTRSFHERLDKESSDTHVRMPTLLRQLLHEALELREAARIPRHQALFEIHLSEAERLKLSKLGYTIVEIEDLQYDE